jgi:hypothetical protein
MGNCLECPGSAHTQKAELSSARNDGMVEYWVIPEPIRIFPGEIVQIDPEHLIQIQKLRAF